MDSNFLKKEANIVVNSITTELVQRRDELIIRSLEKIVEFVNGNSTTFELKEDEIKIDLNTIISPPKEYLRLILEGVKSWLVEKAGNPYMRWNFAIYYRMAEVMMLLGMKPSENFVPPINLSFFITFPAEMRYEEKMGFLEEMAMDDESIKRWAKRKAVKG